MPNKINPYSQHALQVQQEVLQSLTIGNRNTGELSKMLNRPYHTVRQAVLELENNGTIVPVTRSYRNTMYKIADGTIITNRILPTIKVEDRDYKFTILMQGYIKPSRAAEAASNMAKHVTRILRIAQRLHAGDEDAANSLPLIQHEMEMDRDAILNLLKVYDQLIKNGKVWTPQLLKNFPNDAEWDQDTLNAAYAHYFG